MSKLSENLLLFYNTKKCNIRVLLKDILKASHFPCEEFLKMYFYLNTKVFINRIYLKKG